MEKILTVIFLVTTMLSIGLKAGPGDLLSALRARSLMIRSLATNLLLVPILGFLLVKSVPMSADVAAGLLLLAAAPGGLNAIQFTSKTSAGISFAAVLLFVLSFLSVLVSPFIASLMLSSETPLVLSYGKAFGVLLLCVVLPLLAGVSLRRAAHRVAELLAKPTALCGTVAFVVVVVLMLARRKEAMATLTAAELAAMLCMILGAMVAGWFMGGPARETRIVLATGSSMRNAALALMIAVSSFPDTNVAVAVVAFSGLMIPPNMLFTLYQVISAKRRARHATARQE